MSEREFTPEEMESMQQHAARNTPQPGPDAVAIVKAFTDSLVEFAKLLQSVSNKQDLTYGRIVHMAEAVDRINADINIFATSLATIATELGSIAQQPNVDDAVEAQLSPLADKLDALAQTAHQLANPQPATSTPSSSSSSSDGSQNGSAAPAPTSDASGSSDAGSSTSGT